jgi:hypothetical protein
MPLSSSSVDRRIPEALSTSRGKPAGVSERNWIQTMPGKGWNTILRLYSALARSSLSTDAEAPTAVIRRSILLWRTTTFSPTGVVTPCFGRRPMKRLDFIIVLGGAATPLI